MSRVGWATVIGCVFGVLLFGVLQRGCDVGADSGVVVLPREEATSTTETTTSGPRVAPAPAPSPERAISGPTSRPQGTPQTMQVAAQRAAEARRAANQNVSPLSEDSAEWLRQQREDALENRRRAMEIARNMRPQNAANQGQPARPITPGAAQAGAGGSEFPRAELAYEEQGFVQGQEFVPMPSVEFGAFVRQPLSQGRTPAGAEGAEGAALDGVALGGSGSNLGGSGGGDGFLRVRGNAVQNTGGNDNGDGNGNGDGDGDDDGDDDGSGDGGGTPVTAPAAPGLVGPANGATGVLPTLTLTWGAAARATTYTVQVSTNAEFTTLAFTQAGVTGTSLPIPTGRLSAGTSYFWRVISINSAGQAPSASRAFSTLAGPGAFSISEPANAGAPVVAPVTLRWGESQNATAYSVVVASDQAFTQVVASASGLTGTSFLVPDGALEEGRDYWWRVIASNPAGSALASPVTAQFSVLGPPGAFALVSPSDNAANQFVPTALAWSPSRFATSYRVEVATDANFMNPVVNRDGITAPALLLTASDIQPGRTYWWRVTAKNQIDLTGSSQVFSFSTAPLPGEFSLTSPANNANIGAPVTLRWSESERALLYIVQVARDEAMTDLVVDEFVIPLLTGETAFTVPDGLLQNGQSYFWRIEAQNEVGSREAQTPVFRFTIRTTDFDINADGVVDVRDLYAYHEAATQPDLNLDGQSNNDDRIALRNRIRENEKTTVSSGRSN